MAHGTVLLVEDNPDDVALTMRAFRKLELEPSVHVATDGAAALDYLFGSGVDAIGEPRPLPQVVLLDLNLPKIDGLEVLRRIRASALTRHLPVVVLTSSLEERDMLESYKLGANSYVRKPVDYVEFVSAAGQLGLYWLLLNRPAPAPPSV